MHGAQACLENVSPSKFWPKQTFTQSWSVVFISKSDSWVIYCLNGGVLWLFNTEGYLCFIYKENTEMVYHHFIDCPPFRDNHSSLWYNVKTKIINFSQTDGITMFDFMTNLDLHKKVVLLLVGLSLPFDDASVVLIKRFVASVVGKIDRMRTAKLCELKAPLLTK